MVNIFVCLCKRDFQPKATQSLGPPFTFFPNEELTFCDFVGSGIRSDILGVDVTCFNHHTRSARSTNGICTLFSVIFDINSYQVADSLLLIQQIFSQYRMEAF